MRSIARCNCSSFAASPPPSPDEGEDNLAEGEDTPAAPIRPVDLEEVLTGLDDDDDDDDDVVEEEPEGRLVRFPPVACRLDFEVLRGE